ALDASARARASATSTGSTSPAAGPRGSTPHDGSPSGTFSFTGDAESCTIVNDPSSAPGFRFRRRKAYGFNSRPVHFHRLGQWLRNRRSTAVGQSWGNRPVHRELGDGHVHGRQVALLLRDPRRRGAPVLLLHGVAVTGALLAPLPGAAARQRDGDEGGPKIVGTHPEPVL